MMEYVLFIFFAMNYSPMAEKIEVILIDVGNTSVKTTEVINGEFVNTKVWKEELLSIIEHYESVPLMVSS